MFVPQDPRGPDELERRGQAVFDFGMFWFKGQHMGSGQCPVKRYDRYLRNLIHVGKAKPSWIVSHELPLTEAPEGYRQFDSRDNGLTKVVLAPGKSKGRTAAA